MIFFLTGLVLLSAYAFLISTYFTWWKQLPDANFQATAGRVFISVIVAARNERENLPALFAALKAQSYPRENFEVLIVDDHSTDGSDLIIKEQPGIRYLLSDAQAERSSKKAAIRTGIEKANGELMVCTDADCVPPADWLTSIAAFYAATRAKFIVAPVRYLRSKEWNSVFQTIDFLTLQGITAASVSGRFHSMCNGANIAYSREAFFEVNGFEGIDQVASGDDMLLMYKIWKKYPLSVHYLKSDSAMVETKPAPGWKAFFRQRIRWASKTVHYDDKKVFFALLLTFLLNIFFVLLFIAAFFRPEFFILFILFLILKTLVEYPFVRSVARFFGYERLMKYFFLFQPLHIFYIVYTGFASQLGSYEWKGRKTK